MDRVPRLRGDGLDMAYADLALRMKGGTPRGSWFEKLVQECVESPRIPPVVRQYEIRSAAGVLVARPDLAIPSLRLGIEAHSRTFHTGPRREAFDERRDFVLYAENVLDGLFHIAKADHAIHEDELTFLEHVAEIFGFKGQEFTRIRARHVAIAEDPYEVLGVTRGSSAAVIKQHYRKLARDLHPDKQMSKGVPEEMVQLASDRLARINVAYEQVMKGLPA